MREFVKEYPEQKIKEIHCDEWGAGPDKPGRLHPGRAIVWFHYLENVYPVDRACRANWGNADDYLGGIVTPKGEPYPVYHAYRLYAQAKGQTRVEVVGNGKTLAALASKDKDRCEIILGSIQKGVVPVTLELKGLGAAKLKAEARLIPATNLDAPLADKDLPIADCGLTIADSQVRITLQKVEENQAYHIVLTKGN
jgi:hypothetical protein